MDEAEELEYLQLKKRKAMAAGRLKDAPADTPAPGIGERVARAAVLPVQTLVNAVAPGTLDTSNAGISAMARPVLEAGGAVGGAMLAGGAALPTGPGAALAASGGGALGFAGGKSAADLLDRALGVKAPIPSLGAAVKETAGNVVDGAMAEAMGLGTGAVLKGAAGLAPAVGKRAMTAVLGPAGKDIEMRFARNAEVRAAKPLETLAQELPESANALKKTVSDLSGKALDKLSRATSVAKGAFRRDALLKEIYAQKEGLGDGISDATKLASDRLDRYVERLNKLPATLSEYDVGKFIRDFDHDINWDKAEMAPLNSALEGLRHSIDTRLKGMNKQYAEAMIPTAEATGLLVKVRQLFNLKNDVGHGFVPGNNTATALKGAVDERRLDSQSVLEGLKKYTGRDFLRDVENSLTADKFRGGKAQGSRRAVPLGSLGAGAGAIVAGPSGAMAGGAAGTLLGMNIDTYGHEYAGSIVDQLVKLSQRRGARAPSAAYQAALRAAAALSQPPTRNALEE